MFLTKCKKADLKTRLLKLAGMRVFFDIANQTIAKIRELQKNKWIEDFKTPGDFSSSDKALEQLKASKLLNSRSAEVAKQMKVESIVEIFRELELDFLGGTKKPDFGKGNWLERMRGKPLLSSLVSECFEVKDSDGKTLTGPESVTLVAEELLQQDIAEQPTDFQELHALISARVKKEMIAIPEEEQAEKPKIWFKLTFSLPTMHPTRESDTPVIIPLSDDQKSAFG